MPALSSKSVSFESPVYSHLINEYSLNSYIIKFLYILFNSTFKCIHGTREKVFWVKLCLAQFLNLYLEVLTSLKYDLVSKQRPRRRDPNGVAQVPNSIWPLFFVQEKEEEIWNWSYMKREYHLQMRIFIPGIATKEETSRRLGQTLPQWEHNDAGTLITDAQPPELRGHELLQTKPHSRHLEQTP